MKYKYTKQMLIVFFFYLWALPHHALCAVSASTTPFSLQYPVTHSMERPAQNISSLPQKVWRLAYVEPGEHTEFRETLISMAHALEVMGLIKNGRIPHEIISNKDDVRSVWDWLTAHAGGDRIQFLSDGFYSAHWDKDVQISMTQDVFHRIRTQQDIDVLLAFGTVVGIDAVRAKLPIPVFVLGATDPISAGIVAALEDSGNDNIHAQVNTWHFQQQLRVFYDIFNFETLGIAYSDTPEGRAIVALSTIEEMCRHLDVELVRCTPPLEGPKDFDNLAQCMEQFAEEVDAVYMTSNVASQIDRIEELLSPLIEMSIPTFAQGGIKETEHGVLMSFAQDNFFHNGMRAALALKSVMEGVLPRNIAQESMTSLDLAINLKTAQDMYWDIPFDVLLAADVLFHKDGKFE